MLFRSVEPALTPLALDDVLAEADAVLRSIPAGDRRVEVEVLRTGMLLHAQGEAAVAYWRAAFVDFDVMRNRLLDAVCAHEAWPLRVGRDLLRADRDACEPLRLEAL